MSLDEPPFGLGRRELDYRASRRKLISPWQRHFESRRRRRTVNLRPGDQIMWHKHWRYIERVTVCRDAWLTEAEALACQDEGYVYRPVRQTRR